MRAFLFIVVFLLSTAAEASNFQIDLTKAGGAPNTGGSFDYSGPCYCGQFTAFFSPVYELTSGSTVNFGTVEFQTVPFGQSTPDGGPNQQNLYVGGYAFANFQGDDWTVFGPNSYPPLLPAIFGCPIDDASCNANALIPIVQSLNFTIPAGSSSIQIVWASASETATYVSPVPEPSTWAMLLIGFAGIGFATYRRPQKLYP